MVDYRGIFWINEFKRYYNVTCERSTHSYATWLLIKLRNGLGQGGKRC